jgi:16S rRNA (guanine527-N7)-methyltransferase
MTPAHITSADDFAARFSVSRETIDSLTLYAGLLVQWQRTINLVAPSTLGDVWHRHFADSAQLLALAPPSARAWLDLGSGAGFPGLVLAIMLRERPGVRMTLIESDTRKAAFLGEVARRTGAVVDIRAERAEKVSTQAKITPTDVITARALASLDALLALSRPWFGANTTALFLKGRDAGREIEEAKRRWQFDCRREPSLTEAEASVLVIEHLRRRTEG